MSLDRELLVLTPGLTHRSNTLNIFAKFDLILVLLVLVVDTTKYLYPYSMKSNKQKEIEKQLHSVVALSRNFALLTRSFCHFGLRQGVWVRVSMSARRS